MSSIVSLHCRFTSCWRCVGCNTKRHISIQWTISYVTLSHESRRLWLHLVEAQRGWWKSGINSYWVLSNAIFFIGLQCH